MPKYTAARFSFFLIYLVWVCMAREHSSSNKIANTAGNISDPANRRDGKRKLQ